MNRIAGGRSWVQAQQQPGFYAVSLSIEGETTVALVAKEKYERLYKGGRVRVILSHTRISNQLLVVEIN